MPTNAVAILSFGETKVPHAAMLPERQYSRIGSVMDADNLPSTVIRCMEILLQSWLFKGHNNLPVPPGSNDSSYISGLRQPKNIGCELNVNLFQVMSALLSICSCLYYNTIELYRQ